MGHAASIQGCGVDLCADDTALLAAQMNVKYLEYVSLGRSETEMYEALSRDHEAFVSAIVAGKASRNQMSPTLSPPPNRSDVIHRSLSEEGAINVKNGELVMNDGPEEESPAVITRSQSHKELASPVARGLGPASPDLIIPGVHNLRESIPEETCASVSSPAAGATFRKRRLTMADSKSPATFESVAFPRRATIFASSEIGEISEVPPPFPTDILGTYSCHGIEPVYGDDDEEVGVAKKINQDRGCVVYPFNRSRAQALFMVMDGHGSDGNLVSEHVMRKIVPLLEVDRMTDPASCFRRACLQVDKELKETKMKYMTSGTTLVAIYTLGQRYWVACVGDSRAVLAREVADQFVAIDLTIDQKPNLPLEKSRILKAGGFVGDPDEDGLSSRVYLDEQCTKVGLAVSRSIGDHIVKGVGVTAEPVVSEYELDDQDQFFILASDGVWEFMSSQEAVNIVRSNLSLGAEKACQALIQSATAKWQEEEGDYRDDITAIVVVLPLPCQVILPSGIPTDSKSSPPGVRMRRAISMSTCES